MIWEWVCHRLARASSRIGGAGALSVTAIVVDPLSFIDANIHPAVYALGYTILVALIVIRWVIKYGRTSVQRSPEGEMSRLRERVSRLEARNERLERRCEDFERWRSSLVVVNGQE